MPEPTVSNAVRAEAANLAASTRELAEAEEGRGFSSLVPLDRARGGGLVQAKSLDDLPENLVRQLYDPSIALEQQLYLISPTASNGTVDYYGTRMMTSSLKNYAADATEGLPFLYMHQPSQWLGRVYDGHYKQARAPLTARTEMDVFMPVDMKVNGIDTSQMVTAFRSGVARDVSITFDPGEIICSLDGRKMARSFWDIIFSDPDDPDSPCSHMAGIEYEYEGKMQLAIGQVEDAHTIELSSVYRGATTGAQLPYRSRAVVVEDNAIANLGDAIDSLTLRSAGWQAELGRLGRREALLIESRFRGVRFPSITNRSYAPGQPAETAAKPTEQESRGMTTPAEPTAAATATAVADPPVTERSAAVGEPAVTEPAAETVATPPSQSNSAAVDPPPATGTAVPAVVTPVTPVEREVAVEIDAVTARFVSAMTVSGLLAAPEAGKPQPDPFARIAELGTELKREKAWGDWGRRYRTELQESVRAEGVRAFGGTGWNEAAYAPTINGGTPDDLLTLVKHLRGIGDERLRGGRATKDDPDGDPPKPAVNGHVIPDSAYGAR